MSSEDKKDRSHLPIPTPERSGLVTYDAKDPDTKFAPIEQLALSPQCGFSSGIGGDTMTIDEEVAKLSRMVEVTREVWGTA